MLFKRQLIRSLLEAVYILTVTFAIGKWAVCMAYLERGYKAVGGEYILIPMVCWAAWKSINYLFDTLEKLEYERNRKKRRSGRSAWKQDNG